MTLPLPARAVLFAAVCAVGLPAALALEIIEACRRRDAAGDAHLPG